MSKKFTNTQQSYRVFEMETLAILKALLKWKDKLIGRRIHVVTNHRTLEFFKRQPKLSNRQMCWMEFLSRFDFDIRYIKGPDNEVADSLSQYYRNDTKEDNTPFHCYVNADIRLNPEGDDLPWGRMLVICIEIVYVYTRSLPIFFLILFDFSYIYFLLFFIIYGFSMFFFDYT